MVSVCGVETPKRRAKKKKKTKKKDNSLLRYVLSVDMIANGFKLPTIPKAKRQLEQQQQQRQDT